MVDFYFLLDLFKEKGKRRNEQHSGRNPESRRRGLSFL